MANPTVEKLKVFGLRHGEKLAMGTVALIFAFCAYSAWVHPSIPLTPEEVQKTARDAQAHLQRPQDNASILTNLANAGVKPQGFEKKVDAMQAGVLDVAKYKLDKPFVIPEPGAGLIRDMPELLAPSKLYVHSGRGAVRVFALNDDGKFILKDDEDPKKGSKKAAKPKARGSALGLGGMGGGAAAKKPPKSGALAAAEKAKEDEADDKRKKAAIAGIEDVAKNEEPKPAEEEASLANVDKYETKLRGYRFVTAVGTFDHKRQKELYAKALKIDAASAAPRYLRLQIERQEQKGDNSWSDWKDINREPNEELLSMQTELAIELVPDEARINTLVDPLPFLEVGYWVGAHPAALVPKALLAIKPVVGADKASAAEKSNKNMLSGNNSGPMSAKDYEKQAGGGPGAGGAAMEAGMRAAGGGGGAMNFGQAPKGISGAPSGGDYEKSDADAIMVRALDFDVKPDATYRYRVRIVFANPNLGWESVSPGVDVQTKRLNGPWSPTTAEVGIPADIATYATGKTPAVAGVVGEAIHFEVVAWTEQDGLTLVKSFDEAPGQIIGSKENVSLPDDKGSNKTKQIDFTSRQVLADTVGGTRPQADVQAFGSTRLEVPVMALVVRADGMLVLRDQAKDAASGEMAEMKAIFEQIKSDGASKSKKTNSTLGGALGTMGGGGGLRGAD